MKLKFKEIDGKLIPTVASGHQIGEFIENVEKCTVSSSEQETIMTLTVSIKETVPPPQGG